MYVKKAEGHVLLMVAIILLTVNTTNACKGCVELDEITFRRVPLKFNYSLIKFDIAFPYGDKHEAYSQLALQLQTVPPLVDDLLFGLVGIKDYGDKDNADLARKYQIDEKAYPAILLFNDNLDKEIARFPLTVDVTVDNLKNFLRENTRLYIGLPGCIYEFDKLVDSFTTFSKLEKENILQKIVAMSKLNKDNINYVSSLGTIFKQFSDRILFYLNFFQTTTANMYTLYIQKIIDKGEGFLKEESGRLEKLLKKGQISTNKKNELETKINVLKSFETKGDQKSVRETNDEL